MGNQTSIKPKKQEVKQDIENKDEQQENILDVQEEKTLLQIYERIVYNKNNLIHENKYDDIVTLKARLMQFLEDNQLKIFQSVSEHRYLLYRFIEDYRDCFFLTINKKSDNDLYKKLKQYLNHFQPEESTDILPTFDIEHQFNILVSYEKFKKETKTEIASNIQKLYEKIYKQQKDEESYQFLQVQSDHDQEFNKDQSGDDIYYFLKVRYDHYQNMIKHKQQSIFQTNCLCILQPSQFQSQIIQILSLIIFYLESELIKEVDQMTINVDDDIILYFVKNLIQMANYESDNVKQRSYLPQIKYMIYLISLHFSTILEKKGGIVNSIYEEIWLFITYYEKQYDAIKQKSLIGFRIEKEIKTENYEKLINLKYKADKFSDIIDYLEEIKKVNRLNIINLLPDYKELNTFNQSLIHLSGDSFGEQEDIKVQPNTYQKVINFYLKDSSSNTKTLFIEGQMDSGKTYFIKKLINQIEEHNKKEQQKIITPIYLRAKYFKFKKSQFSDTLLSEPLNLTLSQKNILLENGIKIFIIDGLSDLQIKRKKIIKLLKSIVGKNVNFLITVREESLQKDVIMQLQNYSILQLLTVNSENGVEKDYEPFKIEEKNKNKKLKDHNRYKINFFIDKMANIQIIKDIRIIAIQYKKTFKALDIFAKVQNIHQLIEEYINFTLEFSCFEAMTKKSKLKKYDEKHIKLCKEYLQCLAFASYLNENQREDEDFSAQDDDVLPYLSAEAIQQLGDIKSILSYSNLILQNRDDIGLFDSYKPYNYFKLSTIFQYFLVVSFLSDFEKQQTGENAETEEKLKKYKINQRPIIRSSSNKFQVDILNILSHKLIDFKQINSQEIDEQNKNQENQVNNAGEENQSEIKDNIQKNPLYNNQNAEKIVESIGEMSSLIIDYMKRSNTPDSSFRIGASNIISALFQSNIKVIHYNFQDIYFPYAYFNYSIQQSNKFSQQQKNNSIILKNSKLQIPGCNNISTRDIQFNTVCDYGSSFLPKQLTSFNDNTLFFISHGQIFRYQYDENLNQFEFTNISDLNQKKTFISLRKCKKYLYCSTISDIYRIEPKSFQFKPLEFEGKYNFTFSVFAVSDCGQFIATSSSDNKLIIWSHHEDQSTLKVHHEFTLYQLFFIKFMQNDPNIIAFSFDNQSKVCILNISKNQKSKDDDLNYEIELPNGSKICSIDFHGNLMVTGSYDSRFRIYEINSADESKYKIINTVYVHTDYIRQVQFSSCGKYILVASDDYSASIYDIEKKSTSYVKGKHTGYVMFATFLNNNKMIATSCHEGVVVNIWNVSQITTEPVQKIGEDGNNEAEQNKPKGKEQFIQQISQNIYSSNYILFSQDNNSIAQATPQGKINIWKIIKDKQNDTYQLAIQSFVHGHQQPVTGLSFSPDKKLLASCSNDRKIFLWNIADNYKLINQKSSMEHDDAVNCVTFSPNTLELASGGWDDCIKIWKVNTQNIWSLKLSLDHEDAVLSLAYSLSGDILVSGSVDKNIKIWKVSDNYNNIKSIQTNSWVYSLHFTSNGKYLIGGFKDGGIQSYETQNFKLFYENFSHSGSVSSVSSINNGKIILSGSYDQNVQYNKIDQKGSQRNKITAHSFPINSIAVSQNQKLVVTSSKNCIKLFKFNPNYEQQQIRHETEIKYTCFTSNGILASIETNGILKMWDSNNRFQQIASFDTQHPTVQGRYFIIFPYNCEYFATCTSNEVRIWNKFFKLIKIIPILYQDSQVFFSHHSKYLVIYFTNGVKYYQKSDNFQTEYTLIAKEPTITKYQVLTYLTKYSGDIPFIRYSNYETFFDFSENQININLKRLIFSPDDKYMFMVHGISNNISCYEIKEVNKEISKDISKDNSKDIPKYEFQSVSLKIDDQIMTNFNNYFFVKNFSHLNNLTDEEEQNYTNVLIKTPCELYGNISYISTSYKHTTNVSYNFKYYCTVYEANYIWVYRNYEYIQEELKNKVIDIEDEFEEIDVEIEKDEEVEKVEEVTTDEEVEDEKECEYEEEIDEEEEVEEDFEVEVDEEIIVQNSEQDKTQQINQQQMQQETFSEKQLEDQKDKNQDNILNNQNDQQENKQQNKETENSQNNLQKQDEQNFKQENQEQKNDEAYVKQESIKQQNEEVQMRNDEEDQNKVNIQGEQKIIQKKKVVEKRIVTKTKKVKVIKTRMEKVMVTKQKKVTRTVKGIEKKKVTEKQKKNKTKTITYREYSFKNINAYQYPDYWL